MNTAAGGAASRDTRWLGTQVAKLSRELGAREVSEDVNATIGAHGSRQGWGPYLLVLAGAATGLVVIALGAPPWTGGVIIGVSLIVGAVLRLMVPETRAGLMVARTRKADAFVFAAMGALLVVGSLSLLLRFHAT